MPAHYGKKKPDVKGPQPGGPGSVAKKPAKMVAKKRGR